MANQKLVKGIVVAGTKSDLAQGSMQIALVNPDGSTASTVKTQAAQTNSTASDVAGVVTDFNALLVKLRAAGVIAP